MVTAFFRSLMIHLWEGINQTTSNIPNPNAISTLITRAQLPLAPYWQGEVMQSYRAIILQYYELFQPLTLNLVAS